MLLQLLSLSISEYKLRFNPLHYNACNVAIDDDRLRLRFHFYFNQFLL